MKTIYSILICGFLFQTIYSQERDNPDFDKIYSFVLQGDVQKVLSVLDTLPEASLNPEERRIKMQFNLRFRSNEEANIFNTADPRLQEVLSIYQSYWKKVLLNKNYAKEYEEELRKRVISFLKKQNYPFENDSKFSILSTEEIENKFGQYLKSFLKEIGYNSVTGKTAGIFDLFLWCDEVSTNYDVQLPETKITTTVIFLEDVITMGWEEYASFGKVYPGGWATKELLYAVGRAYDTTSEKFQVSYLKHESQHFADYKDFPNLTGVDLEYRAKLTELIYAEETLLQLIGNFIRNANSEGRNPHAFGGYAVIRDLSKIIFEDEFVSDLSRWERISPIVIKTQSEHLLKKHSKSLSQAGASTVKELIR